MKISIVTLSLALLFGLSSFTTSTFAADSSGVYGDGFIKCTIFNNNGTKVKTGKVPLTVLVDQGPTVGGTSNLNMDFDFFSEPLADGTQFDDQTDSAQKAAIGAVSCSNNPEASTLNIVANATLKKADKESARLKGTLSFTDDDRNGTCKFRVKRTNLNGPEVPACNE